jgi:hypothetical protein
MLANRRKDRLVAIRFPVLKDRVSATLRSLPRIRGSVNRIKETGLLSVPLCGKNRWDQTAGSMTSST